jgi:hypothetical protein
MSRHPFGWSYPPGAENDPNAPWNQVDDYCEVCEKPVDRCRCPECPVCGVCGDPRCYQEHGLVRQEPRRIERYADELPERDFYEGDDPDF